jgi:hypothetical protein
VGSQQEWEEDQEDQKIRKFVVGPAVQPQPKPLLDLLIF